MIGLADLAGTGRDWDTARRSFTWPAIDRYNIAADCLRAPADRPAVLGVRTTTFGELAAASAALARYLLVDLGCRPGDRVAVKLSQSVDMAVCVLAGLRAGLVVVPLSTVLGEDGLRHRVTDSEPRVLIAEGTADDAELAGTVGADLIPTRNGLPTGRPPDRPVMADTDPGSAALLMYTSGTTGKPKGVLHGHRVLLGHHAISYALDGVRADDVAYSPVDWAWAGGLLLGLLVPLAHGIPVVAYRQARFDPQRVIAVLREHGVSVGLFPPTALRLLRDSGRLTGDTAGLRVRCLVTGAEAVEPELAGWTRQAMHATLNNAYGQTEANALVGHSTLLGPLDAAALGRPYPGHTVAVLDERLRPVPAGVAGQIAVRADDPVCMLRYWRADAATAATVRDGWLLTGDTAHADESGQLFFHGRDDDLIKTGGYRLGPAEIESALLAHPAVAECAVIGVPDAARGEVVAAHVRLRPDVVPDEELTQALRDAVRRRVGAHAVPRSVVYVDALPRTSTGKVDRAGLRASAVR
ncbi:MAG TPA: AMP-binding protein [Pseudonocardiaceae bacterium]|nr:AMP-binding protein [Pseudonocardiaceae bacterium]